MCRQFKWSPASKDWRASQITKSVICAAGRTLNTIITLLSFKHALTFALTTIRSTEVLREEQDRVLPGIAPRSLWERPVHVDFIHALIITAEPGLFRGFIAIG